MTVEIRTNPPVVKLTVIWNPPSGIQQTASLDGDPLNEIAAAAGRNARIGATMPKIDTTQQPTTKQMLAWQKKLDAWNDKTLSATSVFIDGLDELNMLLFINVFNRDPAAALQDRATFKGTRFAGADRSMCAIAARCLKEGLGDDLKVQIGVKTKWEVADVVRYGVAIREALAKKGIKQPTNGYKGAKSGLLQNVFRRG